MNLFYHTLQILAQQHYQKVLPWDTLGSMPYSWLSHGLDLTQIVMDIRKQIQITVLIINNNLCFNKIFNKSFPGTAWVRFPTPGCPGLWTSPRCSWMSKNSLKLLFSSYLTTFVSTKFPKSHSLGKSRFNALLLGVRGSGPNPDGHGHQETTKINLFYHTQQLLL